MRMIEKMCPTPNGSWIRFESCLCSIDCVECGRKIDLHFEDTMGEHCLTCYWQKRDIVDDDDYEGNEEWDDITLGDNECIQDIVVNGVCGCVECWPESQDVMLDE